jgi:hypothetical protein
MQSVKVTLGDTLSWSLADVLLVNVGRSPESALESALESRSDRDARRFRLFETGFVAGLGARF